MTTPQLRLWSILARSLVAPFSLSAASWKTLIKPVLAFVICCALLLITAYFKLNSTIQLFAQLPVWASIAWFAFEYQRHLIIGPIKTNSEPGIWRRYGVFFLVLILLCLFFAIILGLLLYLVLPAIAWFSMAINSPKPWLASGAVVFWVLVVGTAAYPVVRFALALPAVAAKHEVTPRRIWKLSHGGGLKLLVLLVLIPGLINGIKILAFDAFTNQTWVSLVAGILETYFALVYLSILALSYAELSGQPVPAKTNLKTISDHILGSRFLWPSVLIVVAGISLTGIFSAIYKLEPGQKVIISRFGEPDRVKSGAGYGFKLPFIEKTKQVSEKEGYKIDGNGRFYTISKESISIKYDAYWHVINANRYMQTTAAQPQPVNRRLEHLLNQELRNLISRIEPTELHKMMGEGKNKFSIENELRSDLPFDAVLIEINSRIKELGIEMTNWRFEIDPS